MNKDLAVQLVEGSVGDAGPSGPKGPTFHHLSLNDKDYAWDFGSDCYFDREGNMFGDEDISFRDAKRLIADNNLVKGSEDYPNMIPSDERFSPHEDSFAVLKDGDTVLSVVWYCDRWGSVYFVPEEWANLDWE